MFLTRSYSPIRRAENTCYNQHCTVLYCTVLYCTDHLALEAGHEAAVELAGPLQPHHGGEGAEDAAGPRPHHVPVTRDLHRRLHLLPHLHLHMGQSLGIPVRVEAVSSHSPCRGGR